MSRSVAVVGPSGAKALNLLAIIRFARVREYARTCTFMSCPDLVQWPRFAVGVCTATRTGRSSRGTGSELPTSLTGGRNDEEASDRSVDLDARHHHRRSCEPRTSARVRRRLRLRRSRVDGLLDHVWSVLVLGDLRRGQLLVLQRYRPGRKSERLPLRRGAVSSLSVVGVVGGE
jgi:hypothetical protein